MQVRCPEEEFSLELTDVERASLIVILTGLFFDPEDPLFLSPTFSHILEKLLNVPAITNTGWRC